MSNTFLLLRFQNDYENKSKHYSTNKDSEATQSYKFLIPNSSEEIDAGSIEMSNMQCPPEFLR